MTVSTNDVIETYQRIETKLGGVDFVRQAIGETADKLNLPRSTVENIMRGYWTAQGAG